MAAKTEQTRKAGILCAVSCLPGDHGIGSLGPGAISFIDWIAQAGFRQWALLPMGPTSFGNSPYQSPSSCAGNINYISASELTRDGYLTEAELRQSGLSGACGSIQYGTQFTCWTKLLRDAAYPRFIASGGEQSGAYRAFCRKHRGWLDNYALFMALKDNFGHKPWWEWPQKLANHDRESLEEFAETHRMGTGFWKFTQFIFFRQWHDLKEHAGKKGIELIGDMPFYIAPDSADVWSQRELFAVNPETNRVEMWAGVPSDMFSEHDRNWGNSVYRWEAHKAGQYGWFRQRVRIYGEMYDSLRIDHVIAIMRYYGIKDGETTGQWYNGPDMGGDRLSDAIAEEAQKAGLDIIAEDLGRIPPGLRERIHELGWSGMRIMQYAFVGKYGAKSNHLPLYHTADTVVYTGTHDNPTLREFLDEKNPSELKYMRWWTGADSKEELHWALIRESYKSCANQVIIPIQDVLGLGKEARMVWQNDYGKSWLWKMERIDALDKALAGKMKRLAVLTGRFPVGEKEFPLYLEH